MNTTPVSTPPSTPEFFVKSLQNAGIIEQIREHDILKNDVIFPNKSDFTYADVMRASVRSILSFFLKDTKDLSVLLEDTKKAFYNFESDRNVSIGTAHNFEGAFTVKKIDKFKITVEHMQGSDQITFDLGTVDDSDLERKGLTKPLMLLCMQGFVSYMYIALTEVIKNIQEGKTPTYDQEAFKRRITTAHTFIKECIDAHAKATTAATTTVGGAARRRRSSTTGSNKKSSKKISTTSRAGPKKMSSTPRKRRS
jgi:hypothetical protein